MHQKNNANYNKTALQDKSFVGVQGAVFQKSPLVAEGI